MTTTSSTLQSGSGAPAGLEEPRRAGGAPAAARVPPHDTSAERALLGAMLLTSAAIADAVELTASADFYLPAHAHTFDAIAGLYAAGEPVDTVTVASELERSGLLEAAGGPGALVEMQASTPVAGNAARYADIVAKNATLRRLIGAASDVAELAYSRPADVDAALDQAESLVFAVSGGSETSTMEPLYGLLDRGVDHLEKLYEHGQSLTGVPTGYTDLDNLLLGLQPSSLVILGARPSIGKTSLALGMAAAAAMESRRPVLFFSLEMSHLELTQRLLCSEAGVNTDRVRSGQLRDDDWTRINTAVGRLAEAPLWIDDNPNTSVLEIRAKSRRKHAEVGHLGLVVVDYLQLMGGRVSAESRQVEVSEISRGLKILARELDCPVLALSQLSRAPEARSDKRPMLADLRESGAIEQDADVVMFLYRDEKYNPDSPDRGIAELHVAKHRTGPTGLVKLAFLPQYTRFDNHAQRSSVGEI
ncbi:MAG: replicative DNA helicase [bacterium]|nr:replicative DNA helicase [bacterium]